MSRLIAFALFLVALMLSSPARADEADQCKASRPARLADMKRALRAEVAQYKKAAPFYRWVLKHCELVAVDDRVGVQCDTSKTPAGLDTTTAYWVLTYDGTDRLYDGKFASENESCEFWDATGYGFLLYSKDQVFGEHANGVIDRILLAK
jgi:hypothetical protein